MTVLDASVAVKWFVEEPGSELAHLVLEELHGQLHIPDIFVVEVAAVLVREANTEKSDELIFRNGLFHLLDLIERQSLLLERTSPGQIIDASNLAIDLGHPLKDCIYLKLAMDRECDLITCDARFAAKAVAVWERVRVLGE